MNDVVKDLFDFAELDEGGCKTFHVVLADGETEVEPNGFRAVFTGQELSLRQDAQEVARVADGRLHVNGMAALGGADVGGWRMEDNGDGLAIRWIGG